MKSRLIFAFVISTAFNLSLKAMDDERSSSSPQQQIQDGIPLQQDDANDRAERSRKRWERDLEILRQGIANEAQTDRCQFWLAGYNNYESIDLPARAFNLEILRYLRADQHINKTHFELLQNAVERGHDEGRVTCVLLEAVLYGFNTILEQILKYAEEGAPEYTRCALQRLLQLEFVLCPKDIMERFQVKLQSKDSYGYLENNVGTLVELARLCGNNQAAKLLSEATQIAHDPIVLHRFHPAPHQIWLGSPLPRDLTQAAQRWVDAAPNWHVNAKLFYPSAAGENLPSASMPSLSGTEG